MAEYIIDPSKSMRTEPVITTGGDRCSMLVVVPGQVGVIAHFPSEE